MSTKNLILVLFYLWGVINPCYQECLQQECPDKFIPLNNGCYYISSETSTWFDALKSCGNLNAHLVSIESSEESTAIYEFLKNKHKDKVWYWTSGSDFFNEGEYVWLGVGKPFGYTNWCESQPDNSRSVDKDGENCINQIYSCWNDSPCSEKMFFVCESKLISDSEKGVKTVNIYIK